MASRLMVFPDSSVGKESACKAGDPGSIPGPGRSAGKGIGYPVLCSGLENAMNCVVHRGGVGSLSDRRQVLGFGF